MAKVKNKNKSKDMTLHRCDFCGTSPEEVWSCEDIEGQYCLEHFREMHENVEEFDTWFAKFVEKKDESKE